MKSKTKWQLLLKKVMKANPNLSLKEAMEKASDIYHKNKSDKGFLDIW